MDAEILQAFIEEVESYLPTIRGGILISSQEGKSYGELNVSHRQAHTIKGAAMMIGFEEIGGIAARLEAELENIITDGNPLTEEQARKLLDQVAQIEALLAHFRFSSDDFSLDIIDFVEESFGNLQIGQEPEEEADEVEGEDFEIDEEMLEIFAAEAEDLLRKITLNLEIIEKTPSSREALLEIRRNAHTLKGSAGIVGLKKLSKLAHRVEDLLDFLAENEIEGNAEVFELLLTATDCLNALASGDASTQLLKKIERVEKKFDDIISLLQKKTETVSAAPETTQQTKSAAIVENKSAENQSANNQNRSVVRVSLDRLDELVRLVSEMVISRSVFEQRLAEFEGQIEELRNSTARLHRSTGKLETDFEADMLSAKQFSQPVFSLSSNRTNGGNKSPEFDQLEFDRYTEFHQTTRQLVETASDASAINSEFETLHDKLEQLFDYQRRLIEEMQDKLLRLRMVTFGSLTTRLNRTVRVTAEQEDKEVELEIEGENLEVDTQILDALIEPLLHLLRNAVAHGIETPDMRRLLGKSETGKIHLRIYSEGLHIVLSVTDDGGGIYAQALKEKALQNNLISKEKAEAMSDEETLELIFLPGLTTAEKLSQVSGRGVGMNIVKTNIERQQGTISIQSEMQKGTTFTIRLPMSLAVTRALLVKANGQIFAFPLQLVRQVLEQPAEKLGKFLKIKGNEYAVSYLNKLLELPVSKAENIPVLLIETSEKSSALAVDEVLKAEEIVIKPLGGFLKNLPGLVGAAILGDGSVAPVLDLIYLLNSSPSAFTRQTIINEPQTKNGKQTINENQKPKTENLSIMIVDDSPSVRHINSKLIKNAGWQPIIARDGLEALEILQAFQELPDVILTDVEMPRMDGYELLASLKKQENFRAIPVIMITSRAGEKHRQKAFELGVSEYLVKPYEEKDLLEKIKSLVK